MYIIYSIISSNSTPTALAPLWTAPLGPRRFLDTALLLQGPVTVASVSLTGTCSSGWEALAADLRIVVSSSSDGHATGQRGSGWDQGVLPPL